MCSVAEEYITAKLTSRTTSKPFVILLCGVRNVVLLPVVSLNEPFWEDESESVPSWQIKVSDFSSKSFMEGGKIS